MKAKKVTKKDWDHLRTSRDYFPNLETILFPNNEKEIWIKDRTGKKGFRIVASEGIAGLQLLIQTCANSPPITILAENTKDTVSLGLLIYDNNVLALLHKLWHKTTVEPELWTTKDGVELVGYAREKAQQHAKMYQDNTEKRNLYYENLRFTGLLDQVEELRYIDQDYHDLWKKTYYEELKSLLVIT